MNIQWFPGHMTKSLRMMDENISLSDIIIYVLDSRAPLSCMNPVFDDMFRGKKIIYVLNKSDLGDRSRISVWLDRLSGSESTALTVNSTASGSANLILKTARNMCSEKLEKYAAKGIKRALRAMVTGVPNTGKSTLINNLAGSAKTVTGNRPGVTRGKQWVRVNDYFEVLDTPGTLYPKIEDEKTGYRLAILGSIRDEVVDTYFVACRLIGELNAISPDILGERFGSGLPGDAGEAISAMARKRGYIMRGGVTDDERMAKALIDDFRKGRLGGVTFETAEEYDEYVARKSS